MAAKVINFLNEKDRKEKDNYDVKMPMKCMSCGYKYDKRVIFEEFMTKIDGEECPHCSMEMALPNAFYLPKVGDEIYTCSCGSEIFYVRNNGLVCLICGCVTTFKKLAEMYDEIHR